MEAGQRLHQQQGPAANVRAQRLQFHYWQFAPRHALQAPKIDHATPGPAGRFLQEAKEILGPGRIDFEMAVSAAAIAFAGKHEHAVFSAALQVRQKFGAKATPIGKEQPGLAAAGRGRVAERLWLPVQTMEPIRQLVGQRPLQRCGGGALEMQAENLGGETAGFVINDEITGESFGRVILLAMQAGVTPHPAVAPAVQSKPLDANRQIGCAGRGRALIQAGAKHLQTGIEQGGMKMMRLGLGSECGRQMHRGDGLLLAAPKLGEAAKLRSVFHAAVLHVVVEVSRRQFRTAATANRRQRARRGIRDFRRNRHEPSLGVQTPGAVFAVEAVDLKGSLRLLAAQQNGLHAAAALFLEQQRRLNQHFRNFKGLSVQGFCSSG